MEVITRILSPSSASWVTWVLLFLLAVMVFNRSILQSVSTVWHSLLSYSDRMYSSGGAQSILNTLLSIVFRWGVMAMCVYILCYEAGEFGINNYIKLFGIFVAVFIAQWLLSRLVGYTFLSSIQRENIRDQRAVIYNVSCVILLLFLLPMTHSSSLVLHIILVSVFLLLLIGMLTFRGIQLFNQRPWIVLYILLYIITLELLPIIGVTLLAKYIL